jgi:hypothetical protein
MKNISKKGILLLVLLSINFFCNSNTQVDKSQKVYLSNLKIIERFIINKRTNKAEILDSAVLFMERITNIQSEFVPGHEITLVPTLQNFKDWQN